PVEDDLPPAGAAGVESVRCGRFGSKRLLRRRAGFRALPRAAHRFCPLRPSQSEGPARPGARQPAHGRPTLPPRTTRSARQEITKIPAPRRANGGAGVSACSPPCQDDALEFCGSRKRLLKARLWKPVSTGICNAGRTLAGRGVLLASP